MLWGQKKKPKTDAEMLLEALSQEKKHLSDVKRARERKTRGRWWEIVDRRILIGLGLLLAVVIADGVRRENMEFAATLTNFQGSVSVAPDYETAPVYATLKAQLVDGNVLRTGEKSSATLSFPDGSLVLVGPSSELTVRLLEYNRGGAWRGRSFYLKVGRLWAKVAPGFGKGSEMKVFTPTSVAAVRGTVFAMEQDRAGTSCLLACAEGTVRCAGLVGKPVSVDAGSKTEIRHGEAPKLPLAYTRDEQQALGFGMGALWSPPPEASRLQKFEYALNQMLNAPMTVLGIGKCGWAFGAIDSARRSAAQEALRRLNLHLSGTADFPPLLDVATLKELGLHPKERDKILAQFDGNALLRYYSLNNGRDFVIYARARDVARTTYKLTQVGIERVSREEAEQLL